MKVLISDTSLTSAANAVRTLTGSSGTYTPSQLSDAINGCDCIVIRQRDSSGYPLIVDASHTSSKIILPYQFGASDSSGLNIYAKMKTLLLPAVLQTIANHSLREAKALEEIELPESLLVIGVRSFCGCTALAELTLPKNVRLIGSNAFQNCTSLERVSFAARNALSLPTIDATAFSGCAALSEIRVPWSYGQVSGAPWGAVNADIVYDSASQ